MGSKFNNSRQKEFFRKLFDCGELLFSSGTSKDSSVCADMYGQFTINELNDEDRLDINEDTHVHVAWEDVYAADVGESEGEGVVTISDKDGVALFKFYRFAGSFPTALKKHEGRLL